MAKFNDITGRTFGELSVIGIDPKFTKYPQRFIAKCSCGNISSYISGSLTAGKTKNCVMCGNIKKQKVSDSVISESYSRLRSVWLVAKEVGLCGQSVNERLVKMGLQNKKNLFSDKDLSYLKNNYIPYLLKGKLSELAMELKRDKPFICRKAKDLGLTDISRSKKLLENYVPLKPDWTTRPHPRGMKGKKHSNKTLDRLSFTSKASQLLINQNPEKRFAITKKILETKHKSGVFANARPHATWKCGWREIGGKRKYFRSRWEANYARYLEFLKVNKEIIEWEHEPEVFWFDGIKRGCVSYLPDFRVTELNNKLTYHEVKGWMDERSKTKIKRMAIYHPEIKLIIIGAAWFRSNGRKLQLIIKDWECDNKIKNK